MNWPLAAILAAWTAVACSAAGLIVAITVAVQSFRRPVMTRTPRKYRKIATVTASQWFIPGDHPAVNHYGGGADPHTVHPVCGHTMAEHGWLDTLESEAGAPQLVCPADYIITNPAGEHYPCKPGIFASTYEEIP